MDVLFPSIRFYYHNRFYSIFNKKLFVVGTVLKTSFETKACGQKIIGWRKGFFAFYMKIGKIFLLSLFTFYLSI